MVVLYRVIMTFDRFDMAITIYTHSYSFGLIVLLLRVPTCSS
jgi:hypothetical protein